MKGQSSTTDRSWPCLYKTEREAGERPRNQSQVWFTQRECERLMTTVSFVVYNKLHQTSETLEGFVEAKDMLFLTTVVAT